MYNITISKNADNDLIKSCTWYELQLNGLSKRFLKEFFRTTKFIQANPLLYQVRHRKNYRSAKINGFPFLIIYKIKGNQVLINAVFHTSRHPKTFKKSE